MKLSSDIAKLPWIPGYESSYRIDPNGTIYSYHPHRDTSILKSFFTKNGYIAVNLYNKPVEGKQFKSQKIVAHLLLLTYGPPKPSSKHKVNYIDGNKTNISLKNLAWISIEDIMRKVINGIKDNLKRKPRTQIIVVIDGLNNANSLLKTNTRRLKDRNKGNKKRNYLVFSPSGYEQWRTDNALTV